MNSRRIGLGPRPAKDPGAEAWVRSGNSETVQPSKAELYTARLTIDVTPELRGRIKVIAFQRGMTVADMLRQLLEREFPEAEQEGSPCPLTRVRLAFAADRLNQWLRFGKPLIEDRPDPHYRHVYFAPGAVFGLVDWRANDYGTVRWRLSILRTVGPGERMACISDVEPGAQLLLHAPTPGKTRQVLQLIDAIEAQRIAPEEVSEDYWRVLHQRLVAGIDPPIYTAAEHTAMRHRCELLS